jgi:histidinol-phosphate aminotransferase
MLVGRTSSPRAVPRHSTGGAPKPTIQPRRVVEVPHGGIPPRTAWRSRGPHLVDLSLSTNPYGPPPFLETAWRRARGEASQYPDRGQDELSGRIARHLGVSRKEIVVGGSASELLRCAIVAYGARRSVILPQYTYEEYRRAALGVGARVHRVAMPGLRLDPDRLADAVRPKSLVVLANPGTPDGRYFALPRLRTLIEAVERRRSLLLVDESYLPFVRRGTSLAGSSENVLVVFSWSKMLGTPGIPIGHAVGPPPVIEAVRTQLLPWSVGPMARHLGLLALKNERWLDTTLERVRDHAARVRERLGSESDTHYFPVDVGSAHGAARDFARLGFWVRDLSSMGLPRHIRFAVRRERETERFLAVLSNRLGHLVHQ